MLTFGNKIARENYTKRNAVYGIYINKNNKFLCIKVYGDYVLAGGGVEENEDFKKALKREFIEELGWKISVGNKIGEAKEYFYADIDKIYFESDATFFEIDILDKNYKKPIELDHNLEWLDYSEINKLRFEYFKWIAKKVFN